MALNLCRRRDRRWPRRRRTTTTGRTADASKHRRQPKPSPCGPGCCRPRPVFCRLSTTPATTLATPARPPGRAPKARTRIRRTLQTRSCPPTRRCATGCSCPIRKNRQKHTTKHSNKRERRRRRRRKRLSRSRLCLDNEETAQHLRKSFTINALRAKTLIYLSLFFFRSPRWVLHCALYRSPSHRHPIKYKILYFHWNRSSATDVSNNADR